MTPNSLNIIIELYKIEKLEFFEVFYNSITIVVYPKYKHLSIIRCYTKIDYLVYNYLQQKRPKIF